MPPVRIIDLMLLPHSSSWQVDFTTNVTERARTASDPSVYVFSFAPTRRWTKIHLFGEC